MGVDTKLGHVEVPVKRENEFFVNLEDSLINLKSASSIQDQNMPLLNPIRPLPVAFNKPENCPPLGSNLYNSFLPGFYAGSPLTQEESHLVNHLLEVLKGGTSTGSLPSLLPPNHVDMSMPRKRKSEFE